MSKRLHTVMETFPQYEELIRELAGTNPEFESLCHEYGQVTEKLHHLEEIGDVDRDARSDALRHRRAALADELHALMSQSART